MSDEPDLAHAQAAHADALERYRELTALKRQRRLKPEERASLEAATALLKRSGGVPSARAATKRA